MKIPPTSTWSKICIFLYQICIFLYKICIFLYQPSGGLSFLPPVALPYPTVAKENATYSAHTGIIEVPQRLYKFCTRGRMVWYSHDTALRIILRLSVFFFFVLLLASCSKRNAKVPCLQYCSTSFQEFSWQQGLASKLEPRPPSPNITVKKKNTRHYDSLER